MMSNRSGSVSSRDLFMARAHCQNGVSNRAPIHRPIRVWPTTHKSHDTRVTRHEGGCGTNRVVRRKHVGTHDFCFFCITLVYRELCAGVEQGEVPLKHSTATRQYNSSRLILYQSVLLTHRSSLVRDPTSQRRSCCQAGGHLSAKHRRKHGCCERSDRNMLY